jgi:hypothetical protein
MDEPEFMLDAFRTQSSYLYLGESTREQLDARVEGLFLSHDASMETRHVLAVYLSRRIPRRGARGGARWVPSGP